MRSMNDNESTNPLEIVAWLALGGFVLLAAYISFVIVGLQSGWPGSAAVLSMDDGLVDFVSAVIPKIGRYREFMQQNGYVENAQLMESALAMSWLAFAVLCIVSIPLMPRCVLRIRRLIYLDPRNRGKFRNAGAVAIAFALVILVNQLDSDFGSTSRYNLDRIHLSGWYALFPPLGLACVHVGVFYGLILLIAVKDKAVRSS